MAAFVESCSLHHFRFEATFCAMARMHVSLQCMMVNADCMHAETPSQHAEHAVRLDKMGTAADVLRASRSLYDKCTLHSSKSFRVACAIDRMPKAS